jgi:tetratricopeptide (TPR) repeat protein
VRRLALVCGAVALLAVPVRADDAAARLLAFERSIDADPENLELGAQYRAVAIESAHYDRAIDFLEKVAKRKGGGPNAYISLALAIVDKVPPSGDIRRLYLGRDAMGALSKSIAIRPCVFAYYMRGVINLYYNRFIFNRTDKGIADLTQALAIAPPDTPAALIVRVQTALGDGYHKMGNTAKAHEIWAAAAARFPDDPRLKERLSKHGVELDWAVGASLAAEKRVDTSLSGLLPIR